MNNLIQVGAKYFIILLFMLFTYFSFRVQQDTPEEKKKGKYIAQTVIVFAIHALAFICIFLNTSLMNNVSRLQVAALYAGQLLYLIFMLTILPQIVNLSKGLNNVMCMMLCVGFFMQTRLSFSTSVRMIIYLVAATVIFLVFQFLYKMVGAMHRLTWAYCAASLILLLIVFVFASVSKGAKISISLGFITIQPFEFVKVLFVLFIAGAFNRANTIGTVLYTAAIASVHLLLLVACTELGTALILGVVYVLMLYVATKKFRYILIGAAGFAVACVAAYMLFSHVRVRVSAWLDPWADINNTGYQVTQSLFAIGSGGWQGTGLFRGDPEYVPEVRNDFIFSAISEEMGTVFAIFLILLCLCLTFMIFRVALRIYKPFYKLAAFGFGSAYAFQVFLTVGGAIKFVPSTGINLPFISSGGSSLMASMLMIGIVQGLYVISENDVEFEKEIIQERLIYSGSGEEDEERVITAADLSGERIRNKNRRKRIKQVQPADEIHADEDTDRIIITPAGDAEEADSSFINRINDSMEIAGSGKKAQADDTVIITRKPDNRYGE